MKRLVNISVLFFALALPAFAQQYEIILSDNPQARGFLWDGVDFLAEGLLDDSVNKFELAVMADPDCFIAYSLLYEISAANEDTELMEKYANKLQFGTEAKHHYNDIIIPYLMGEYEVAITECDEYIKEFNNSPFAITALHLMGRSLFYLDEDRRLAWDILNEAEMYSGLMPGTSPAYEGDEEITKIQNFINQDRPK
jgi:tetratricopeptide (TPR) repeat protein